MIIKKISLENIRSYTNQEIEFPEGSILLSGDIGSGKSSILLAIDFALFGLRKGDLSGASLLRNGANEGKVELHFSIDNKNIIIQRVLKRYQNSISQDTGFIIVNGERTDKSAIELKQDILDILNYPKELLTKSKALIYRYTVYTPQEEMKSILLGDKDIRLDTLRRVFDIDKYKRIKENAKLYVTNLKQKRKEKEGKIYDLEDKNKSLKEKLSNINYFNDKLKVLIPKISEINKIVDSKRQEIKLIESNIKILEELKKDLSLNELKLKNFGEKRDSNLKEIELLISNINKLEGGLRDFSLGNADELNSKINGLNSNFEKHENDLNVINRLLNELDLKKRTSFELKDKIVNLETCPLCKQNVTHSHKSLINSEEDKKISEYDKELTINKDKKFSLQDTIKDIKLKLDKLKEDKSRISLYNLKKDNLNEKIQRRDLLLKEQNKLVEEINYYHDKSKQILSRINEFKDLNYEKNKNDLDLLLQKEKNLEIERATLLANITELNKSINSLRDEVNEKLQIKSRINYLNDINFWLEEYFVNIVELIEKQIMLRVHGNFNELFQKWFNMLMEIENFSVRLDEEFTPLIQQNGHDINYEYLSGGEKTAIALAYRLALNQIINNLITTIKTRDLLILDEPTDGFSDEQLDRVKNVLNEIDLKQLIVVSHEQKIESFVDNVLRLNKENHITKII